MSMFGNNTNNKQPRAAVGGSPELYKPDNNLEIDWDRINVRGRFYSGKPV